MVAKLRKHGAASSNSSKKQKKIASLDTSGGRKDAEDVAPSKKKRKSGPSYKSLLAELHDSDDLDEALDSEEEAHHFFEKSGSEDDDKVTNIGNDDGWLRMRPDIVLDEPQYAGIRSSRKEALEEEDSLDSDGEHNFHSTENWSMDENFDDQLSIGSTLYAAQSEEMEALDKEYRELEAQDMEMLSGLRGHNREEILKGQAVRNQKALWDKALEMRILLQKPFSNANRLPLEEIKSSICKSDVGVSDAYTKLTTSSIASLECLTEALEVLLAQNASVDQASVAYELSEEIPSQGFSDDIDDIWQKISALYSRFVPFRNSSVDRWQRKTQLSSGAAASKMKLRAFNQSISQQVEGHMRDFSRMLQRMWLKPTSVDIIGTVRKVAADDESKVSVNGSISEEVGKDAEGDPELIDDTEFYQELLREFLESSDPASIGALYAVKRSHSKRRKVVDRRASKGRKIRYNVHDKIVHFMAPLPANIPPLAEKLFANGLFKAQTISASM